MTGAAEASHTAGESGELFDPPSHEDISSHEPGSAEPVGEGNPAPESETGEGASKPPPDNRVPQSRFDQITREKWEERRRAEAAEARAQELEARLKANERAGEGGAGDAGTPADDERIEQMAQKIVQQREFTNQCNTAWADGVKEYGEDKFKADIDAFETFGGLAKHRPFMEAVVTEPGSHKILHHLATNPDEADRILNMTPIQQAREIGKLSVRLNAPASPPRSSNAPPPPDPIASGGTGIHGPDEHGKFKTQADFLAWRKKTEGF